MSRVGLRHPLWAAALIGVIGAAAAGVAAYPEIQYRRAERALERGRPREAADLLAPLAGREDPRFATLLARAWLRQGRVRSVVATLTPRVRSHPDPAQLAILGEACLALRDERGALDAYRALVAARPDEVPGLIRLAELTYRLEGPAPALELYRRLEHAQPDNPDWPSARGQVAMEIDRYELAVEAFRTALRRAPDRTATRFRLAEAEFLVGDLRGCLADLDRCLAAEPSDVRHALARAECLHALGRTDEAARDLDAVLSRTPDDPKALRLRAELHLERREYEQAALPLERARSLAPEDWRVLYSLARAYEALGRHDEARAQIDEMRRLQGRDPNRR